VAITFFVVVTHVDFLVTRILNGFFGDLHVFVVDGTGSGWVNG